MATLVYSDVDGVDRSFSLGPEPVVIGRAQECTIRSEDPRVSRMHARIFVDQGSVWVEDLGSSNGIFVGPQKVQRAPMPVGEIVLVGSLMIRLLPPSGTLPPPVGLHGTLAQWLEMERKARGAVEEERGAFARRVGELHEELRTIKEAASVTEQEAVALRAEMDAIKKETQHELEQMRVDLAKAREAKIIAETQSGITVAEKMAEADMQISALQHKLAQLEKAAPPAVAAPDHKAELAALTARAEKAEKELQTAQIRAQGAERNLTSAQAAAAKAETRAAELDGKLKEALEAKNAIDTEVAVLREKVAAAEARGVDAPLQAAEARAQKLAADLTEMTQQFETRRDRIGELEAAVAAAKADVGAAKKDVDAARAEASGQAEKVAAAEKARADLEAKLRDAEAKLKELAGASAEIEAARKVEARAAEAFAKAEENEKRASAADTMAKAMAKDVAEALKRAVDADAKARGVARELDGAHKRAEAAEARAVEAAAQLKAAEERAAAAEAAKTALEAEAAAKLEAVQKDLTDKLTAAEQALLAKADQLGKDLGDKLAQAQRELAAERSTAMSLVDRKTQLERELNEARTQNAGLQHRVELAESRVAEYEVQIEQLEERIEDLEAGVAVEKTAASSSLEESRAKLTKLEEQLAEAKAAAKSAAKTAAGLDKRLDAMEADLKAAHAAKAEADAALAEARAKIAELEQAGEQLAAQKKRADDAEKRIAEIEAGIDPLKAKAEAADLAIGRAGGLQRQLDEALQKLSWLERDGKSRDADDGKLAEIQAQADARVKEAEAKLEALEAMVRDADVQVREQRARADAAQALASQLEARVGAAELGATSAEHNATLAEQHAAAADQRAAELEKHVREVETRSKEIETRAASIEAKAKEAAERIAATDRRAREAEAELEQLRAQRQSGRMPVVDPNAERRLAEAQAKIAQLQREVDAAENVRQFAANTEREIAQLERELREAKAKITTLTLERDRMESQLRDVHEDDETNMRSVGPGPEVTAHADMSRYTALVSHATELERKLAETEARLAAQQRAHDDDEEPTNTGTSLPIEFAENLSVLEESIDSLRANMRAASDETAMMDQTDSVIAISAAVSSAAEHVERARDALRELAKMRPA